MKLEEEQLYTDVLVVGSGAAGTMAAIKAAAKGASVLIVTKGPFPSGNSSIALAGYGAPLGYADPRDSVQVYFEDIIRAGQGLCNEKIVRAWTGKIIELTNEMDEWGIDLVKEDGKFSQIPWGGHTYPRMVHHYRSTGLVVMKCLGAKSREMGFKVLEHTLIGGLLREGEAISGAWGFQYPTGNPVFISAKTVIWATGGMGHLFPFTDNVKMATGEGYSIAFRAGAEMTGMEFCHFLRTICYPEPLRTSSVVVGTIVTLIKKGGARHYNNLGQRFMRTYFPGEGDLQSDNEEIVRAMSREIYEGRGGPHGGVYLDVSDVPEEVWEKECASLWEKATRAQINLTHQPLETLPYPHDMIGGIKIDETGRTAVSGLYAAGENAGGAHGAARIGGSALSEAIAFGAICGENAAESAANLERQPEISQIQKLEVTGHLQSLLNKKSGLSPAETRIQIQQIVNKYLNVARDETGLNKALTELEETEANVLPRMTAWSEEEKKRNSQIAEALEVEGQVELAKIIAKAALIRKETRGGHFGGHYRIDYPQRDDKNWLKNIVLKREPGGAISSYTEDPVKA
jgi:fumarate reductase (CoM/CoB) subunit A